MTNRITPPSHRPPNLCVRTQCKSERQDYFNKLIKVCLNRDEATKGWLTPGKWKAVVNPGENDQCKEVFFADADDKTLYLEIPSSGNRMSIRCSEYERAKGIGPRPPSSNYDVCGSDFFSFSGAHSSEKILRLKSVKQALQEAQFFTTIEQHLISKKLQDEEESRKAYKTAFEKANSLETIEAFEQKYRGNDPENLIGRLASTKRDFQVEEYRKRYENLQSIQDMQRFITDYQSDDPDGRLPDVNQRLADLQRQAELETKKEIERKKAEANEKSLMDMERQIRWCKSQMEAAQRAIEREQQVGLVSGYVNKQSLHLAGTAIVECRDLIASTYSQYKQLGGKKNLAKIR